MVWGCPYSVGEQFAYAERIRENLMRVASWGKLPGLVVFTELFGATNEEYQASEMRNSSRRRIPGCPLVQLKASHERLTISNSTDSERIDTLGHSAPAGVQFIAVKVGFVLSSPSRCLGTSAGPAGRPATDGTPSTRAAASTQSVPTSRPPRSATEYSHHHERPMKTSDCLVQFLGVGFVGTEKARKAIEEFPTASSGVVGWARAAMDSGDKSEFSKLVNFAASIRAEGLADLLLSAIDNKWTWFMIEDVVEILGEISEPSAVTPLVDLLEARRAGDEIDMSLCVKCIYALSGIETARAESELYGIATNSSSYPDRLRWHAAYVLDIEDELGFDDDEMTGLLR